MRAALVPCEELAPPPYLSSISSRRRNRSYHDYSGAVVVMDDEVCDSEVWSWWYFRPEQLDPYWIRCTLAGPHTEHEDENTGLKWIGDGTCVNRPPENSGGEESEKGRVSNS